MNQVNYTNSLRSSQGVVLSEVPLISRGTSSVCLDPYLRLPCERDVMVDELAPGHQQDGHGMVVKSIVLCTRIQPNSNCHFLNLYPC
jgi:hypothetical protein